MPEITYEELHALHRQIAELQLENAALKEHIERLTLDLALKETDFRGST